MTVQTANLVVLPEAVVDLLSMCSTPWTENWQGLSCQLSVRTSQQLMQVCPSNAIDVVHLFLFELCQQGM